MVIQWFHLNTMSTVRANLGFQLDYIHLESTAGHTCKEFSWMDHLRWGDPSKTWATTSDESPHKRTWKSETLTFACLPHSYWQGHQFWYRGIALLILEPNSAGFQCRPKSSLHLQTLGLNNYWTVDLSKGRKLLLEELSVLFLQRTLFTTNT